LPLNALLSMLMLLYLTPSSPGWSVTFRRKRPRSFRACPPSPPVRYLLMAVRAVVMMAEGSMGTLLLVLVLLLACVSLVFLGAVAVVVAAGVGLAVAVVAVVGTVLEEEVGMLSTFWSYCTAEGL
jgi:hypothetical protein